MKETNNIYKNLIGYIGTACLVASSIVGCSSGSDDPLESPPPPPFDEMDAEIQGSAVKGPIINGSVTVYELDPAAADLKGTVVATGSTNSSAAVQDVIITANYLRNTDDFSRSAFLIEVTGGQVLGGTTPILNVQRVVITGSEAESSTSVYATPLTTLALQLANLQFDIDALSENDAVNPDISFMSTYARAESQVRTAFGFGILTGDLNLRTISPLLANQGALNYRTAIEATAAIIDSIRIELANDGIDTDNDTLLASLADDLTDRLIDGNGSAGEIAGLSNLQTSNELRTLITQDPSALMVPGTSQGITELDQIILDELSTVAPGSPTEAMSTPAINPAAGGIDDQDKDSFLDSEDAFPLNIREWIDSDGDCGTIIQQTSTSGNGCGDNSDYAPNDPSITFICQDTTVDEADREAAGCIDTDGDGELDLTDVFPNNADEWFDSDGDCASTLGYQDNDYLTATAGNDCGDNYDRNICFSQVTLETDIVAPGLTGYIDGSRTIIAAMDKVEGIIRLGDGIAPVVVPDEVMPAELYAQLAGNDIAGPGSMVEINIVADTNNVTNSSITYYNCQITDVSASDEEAFCTLLVGAEGTPLPLPTSQLFQGNMTDDPSIQQLNSDGTRWILTYENVQEGLALLSTTWEFNGGTIIPSTDSCPSVE